MKQFFPASDRNKEPIFNVLSPLLKTGDRVLELGSGTGQHAGFFLTKLGGITWQPSEQPGALQDLVDSLPHYAMDTGTNLLLPAVELDIASSEWPVDTVEVVYTANTLHMIPEQILENLFSRAGATLAQGGVFVAYGPFSFGGEHVGDNNPGFDVSLRAQGIGRGIRDLEDLDPLADKHGFAPAEVNYLPANNQLLVWRKMSCVANPGE